MEQLENAESPSQRNQAIDSLGALVVHDNKAAFDVLCSTLRNLSLADTLSQSHFKSKLLRNLSFTREYRRELAHLLVEDLFTAPSNNHTRGWYTDVFHFFVGSAWEFAEEVLSPMLDSPKFSYRIKRRVKEIIRQCEGRDHEGRRSSSQIVASNVDTFLLVFGLDHRISVRLVERYLTLVASGGSQPVIVLNKSDLRSDLEECTVKLRWIASNTPICAVSALHDDNLESIFEYIAEK